LQYGFVIDHAKCIGCHACTVACKSENDVQLGSFRTWVKYTEEGAFPQVRRSFAVLRCNQCTDAPCVTICPVNALAKRPDGIVDVDPAACIGCKGCMQGCPYDALYINDATGTAEKCHFCAHRVEVGLAPACAIVCPTEAIIPGDFDDPLSRVSQMRKQYSLTARKVEAGTGPNVLYREVAAAGIEPLRTNTAGGFLWSNQIPGPQLDAQTFEAFEKKASARTVYDVSHPPLWGRKVSAYLFTKSLAGGSALAAGLVLPWGSRNLGIAHAGIPFFPALALLFLLITTALLVADLKRPARFLYILMRPNWGSWIARGTIILTGYGAALALWLSLGVMGLDPSPAVERALYGASAILGALTACYTAWLFGQAKGRVLWMRRGLAAHLIAQAGVAGCALALLAQPLIGIAPPQLSALRLGLLGALAVHLALTLAEGRLAPQGREAEYARVVDLIARGPYARSHWFVGVGAGIALPAILLLVPAMPWAWAAASLAALVGLFVEEDILVRAGQALPIS
jgi:Fe-S-cluster-containing dehydrogenase component/formate-dependent nitrite reductase membrane component NrfD